MNPSPSRPSARLVVAAAAVLALWCLAVSAPVTAQKIKLETQHDETVDFAPLKTWAWHPSGKGEVKLALTPQSDPGRIKALVDPIIVPAVEKEMAARGLRKVDGNGDLLVTYWLLGTIGESSQKMGEFLGAVPEWGLPPFQGATQSMRAFPVGTLLLDMFAANGKDILWRGAARGEVDLEKTPAERKKRIEGAVRDLLKRFPPKK
jgi:hypothetical protein